MISINCRFILLKCHIYRHSITVFFPDLPTTIIYQIYLPFAEYNGWQWQQNIYYSYDNSTIILHLKVLEVN